MIEKVNILAESVVDNGDLDAITKFNRMRQLVGDWKIERKDEMMMVARIMFSAENTKLFHALRTESDRHFGPLFSRIISQGVEEGVFDCPYPREAAEHCLAVLRGSGEGFIDILLNRENYDRPVLMAQKKFAAAERSIERILGAPSGSLVFVGADTIAAWFE